MNEFLKLEINEKSFEDYSKQVTLRIEKTLVTYLNILKLKTIKEMAVYFSLKELDRETICAKKMDLIGAWRCDGCVKNQNIIFCQDCWSQMRDKHKDHNVIFLKNVTGTCDCGDHNCINKQYFCPNHKGIIETDLEIKACISESLGPSLATEFTNVNKLLFNVIFKYIVKAIDEKKTTSKSFVKVINDFVNCFGILCEMSNACNYIICELLMEHYPYKTKHTCLDIKGETGKLIKGSFFNHECTCPFIRFLMEFWPGKKSKLLYRLILDYKLKKMIGLYYFLFNNDFIKNCIKDFDEISVQIIFNDVIKIACNTPGLIDNIFEGMI